MQKKYVILTFAIILFVAGLVLIRTLSPRQSSEAATPTTGQTPSTSMCADQPTEPATTMFRIFESQHFEKDFIVEFNNSLVAYISCKYNLGKITDYRKPGSKIDLTGKQAIYPHLIVGYLSNGVWHWSDGTILESVNLTVSQGSFVEIEQSFMDNNLGFRSSSRHQFHYTNYYVQKVTTILEAFRNIENVLDLYVEFGWDCDNFRYVAVKNKEGQIMVKDLQSRPAMHYFADQKVARGGWICAFNSSIYDASIALIFGSAKRINPDGSMEDLPEITPISWDTDGIYDQTDTIELHIIEASWDSPEIIPAGTKYILVYYIVVSNGEQSCDWIDRVILP